MIGEIIDFGKYQLIIVDVLHFTTGIVFLVKDSKRNKFFITKKEFEKLKNEH